VKHTLAENIVDFLTFSSDSRDCLSPLAKISRRKWERVSQWLHDTGLAFYFLKKLKDTDATGVVPTDVLFRLDENFASNHLRVEDMSRRFNFLNHRFQDAGVHFAVIKGFSLVPQFCPYAPLRHQGDFDYLVDGRSIPAACQVLVKAGYKPKQSRSSKELIFTVPGARALRSTEMYSARAPHAVELHTDPWDSELHGLPPIPPLLSVESARTHDSNGFVFPAFGDEDAFLLQVLHACHHLFTLWIRLSNLYEIAYFLSQRANDTELWNAIEERIADSSILREFVAIVCELASRLFAAPIPPLVQVWGTRIRPGSRIWLEHYARTWAFCELPVYEFSFFPRSKLALFLRQQYTHPSHPRKLEERRSSRSTRLSRIASAVKSDPSLVVNGDWWRQQLLIRRSVFHALAGLRYFCEIPRWLWLNRTRTRSVLTSTNSRARQTLSLRER
jgi:hypothetical protein